MRLKIRPIWYPQGDHSCVCTILSVLAEGKGEPEPSKRPDPGGAASKPSARLKPASWGDVLPAEELSATNPGVYEPDVAGTCNNLANLLSASPEGRKEAEALYREALKLYRNLSATNPSVYEPDVATTCNNLAILLAASPEGRKEAEELFREALALRRKQVRLVPGVYKLELVRVCRNLGRFLQSQGRTEEAAVLFQEAKGE